MPTAGSGAPLMTVTTELGIDDFDEAVEIGRGGFGVVYRARQIVVGRTVAIKLLPQQSLSPDTTRRFERECRAMAALSTHPNIVTMYDFGQSASGRPYIVMEYVVGGALADRSPMDWTEAVDAGIKVAGALETAHRIGIIHRDVKPENVLLSAYGEPKLGDFGIAKVGESSLTSSGHITASLLHAAPEVLSGARPTPRTDVYSLASTIYALIAGRAAFAAESPEETLAPLLLRISAAAAPSLRERGVPSEICRVIERGMAKDSADRPATIAELGNWLGEAQRQLRLPPTKMMVDQSVIATAPKGGTASTGAVPDSSPLHTTSDSQSRATTLFRPMIAADIRPQIWAPGASGTVQLLVQDSADPSSTIRARAETAEHADARMLADHVGRFRAQRTPGYHEISLTTDTGIAGRPGVERRFRMQLRGHDVAMVEQYTLLDGQALVMAFVESISELAKGVEIGPPPPAGGLASRFSVALPSGWTATETLAIRRAMSGHAVTIERWRNARDTTAAQWRDQQLADYRTRIGPSQCSVQPGRVLGSFNGEVATVQWTNKGEPTITKIGTALTGRDGLSVVVTLPARDQQYFADLVRHARLHPAAESP